MTLLIVYPRFPRRYHPKGRGLSDPPIPDPAGVTSGLPQERSSSTCPARALSRHDPNAVHAAHVAAQFRHAPFTPQEYLADWSLHRAIDHAPQVTCAMFRQRAKQRGWSAEWLVAQVTGAVESPAATIKRVMGLADPAALIPYLVLTDLYQGKGSATAPKRGECRYGCGHRVMGRQTFASDACRKRVARMVA